MIKIILFLIIRNSIKMKHISLENIYPPLKVVIIFIGINIILLLHIIQRPKKNITIHTWNDKRESTKNQPELITSKQQQNKMYGSYDINDFYGKGEKEKQKIIDTVLIAHKTYKKLPKETDD